MEQNEKKEYEQPILRTTDIKLGVFGSYGQDDGCGGGHNGRDGHRGGRRGGGLGGGRGGGWPW